MDSNRRKFLIGLATISIAGSGVYYFETLPKHRYVKKIVQNRLPYLIIPQEVLDIFAQEFVDFTPAMNAARGSAVALSGMRVSRAFGGVVSSTLERKIDLFEQRITSDFLKSTDFFDNGCDITIPLGYIAFSSPYVNPCRNPVAVNS